MRANGASGARSLFHAETFQTQRLEASPAPHSQHGGGSAVPLFVYAQEPFREALFEHTEGFEFAFRSWALPADYLQGRADYLQGRADYLQGGAEGLQGRAEYLPRRAVQLRLALLRAPHAGNRAARACTSTGYRD